MHAQQSRWKVNMASGMKSTQFVSLVTSWHIQLSFLSSESQVQNQNGQCVLHSSKSGTRIPLGLMGNQTQASGSSICRFKRPQSIPKKHRRLSTCNYVVHRFYSLVRLDSLQCNSLPYWFYCSYFSPCFKTHTERHVLTNRLAIGPPQGQSYISRK